MAARLADLFAGWAAELRRRADASASGRGAAGTAAEPDALIGIRKLIAETDVSPATLLLAASAAGLFPDRQPPSDLADDGARNRHLLGHLALRDYRVRPARVQDVPALLTLEQRCWGAKLRTPEAVLWRRIARHGEGQLVLVVDGRVAGVIYSQRIADAAALSGRTARDIDALHEPAGPTVQLLAVNVLPELQAESLGDALLELMLTYRSLDASVASVVAVTLCRSFDRTGGVALADYIHTRNAYGVLADPILRFHELHGATVVRPMPGYRPDDVRNEGAGVLVSYDIRVRTRRDLGVAPGDDAHAPAAPKAQDRLAEVREMVRRVLGEARAAAYADRRPLMEMGLDSADLLELREALSQRTGRALPATVFFTHNTAEKIAAYVAADTSAGKAPQLSRRRAAAEDQEARDDVGAPGKEVAIVGMACRLPGGIASPEDLWRVLESGQRVVGAVPPGRWAWPAEIDPAGPHRGIDRGGFLDGIALFDAPFFRISPAEAQSMDPQQRLLLELSWQAIEHAGHAPGTLAGSRTGVFIGASGSDYARLMDQAGGATEAHAGTGSAMAVLANRLSYFYDLTGPSLTLDTACSSSLVAVHEAVRSIASGECAQALVGGVNLILHPATGIAFHKSGMLSKDGLCKTFDADADGYVRSEGAVVLLLKPLAAALADGDTVYAVIRGTACNHGGQASGLTVPAPVQQARLLSAAWRDAHVDPAALGYIEAHGTGTALGDPAEIEGIKAAFSLAADRESGRGPAICGLGSVKTNLGHLEAAAGLAGLLKAVLCLRHRMLPASLNFRSLNPHIDLAETSLFVADRLQPWTEPPRGQRRLAGISSFGSGGTNAHVVVEEHPSASSGAKMDDGPVVFVLSARTEARLRAYAQVYADWLCGAGRQVALGALAHLLQTGRQAMEARLALVVATREDLVSKLARFARDGARAVPDCDAGGGVLTAERVRAMAAAGDLEGLAASWQAGAGIDWSVLHEESNVRRRRFAAPTYPFARRAYWIPGLEVPAAYGAAEDAPGRMPAETVRATLLAPVWQASAETSATASPAPDAVVLIAGGTAAQRSALRARYPHAHALERGAASTVAEIGAQIAQARRVDHIFWISPTQTPGVDDADGLVACQKDGLFAAFKLIKALHTLSYGERDLAWTIVTVRAQAVFASEGPDAAHAGVPGLFAVAGKEHPRWAMRMIDLESADDWPLDEILRLPADGGGEVIAHRSGQWLRRGLCPVDGLAEALLPYRERGVFVVIGGAGGLGEAWTRHVMAACGAQVVWIGRRAADAEIEKKIAALSGLDAPAPVYVQADAADATSLRAAYRAIKARWPAVHGVVHAALGPFDKSLADMDEAHFRAVLAAKVDASVRVAEVFAAERLDFLVAFSSIVALERTGGYAGYAAGGAFADAFFLALRARGQPAKVINWGHWALGSGAQISEATRTRLARGGLVPIEAGEAMRAIDALLDAPVGQLALVKRARLAGQSLVDTARTVTMHGGTASRLPDIAQRLAGAERAAETLGPVSLFNNRALDAHLVPLLAATLRRLGLLDGGRAALPASVPAFYARWLAASRRILAAAPDVGDLDAAWRAWARAKTDDLVSPDLSAAVALAEVCLTALPDILSGRARATDVIFPGASMRRVDGIYRGNAVADHFNCVLGDALVALVAARLAEAPAARLSILEVGAGTGGTTACVLPRLAPYRERIADYAYTDLSKAFLFHAEEEFAPHYPFVTPRLLDVERPLAGQGIAPAAYDIVIATNVLHATRDIRRTLQTCKAALRKGGLLLLNEISTPSLFAHVTFGLLEGWWLSEDQGLRMPDSPGLAPERWREVLRQEGFPAVVFPAARAHGLGQQVIVAESDGVVCQAAVAAAAKDVAKREVRPVGGVAKAATADAGDRDAALHAAASAHVRSVVARTLRMDAGEIDVREPLGAYGIDSILVVQITDALRRDFREVRSTLLFQCQTVDAMGAHLARHYRDEVARLAGPAVAARAGAAPALQVIGAPMPAAASIPAAREAIAIVGLSCRFPGADTAEAFWELLKSGRSAVGEVPAERWSLDHFYHADPDEAVAAGKSYGKWGAFLDGVTAFDPLFFNIAPKDAVAMDPQERLFLQTAWAALEDAGYTPERLVRDFDREVGVYVGITRTGFDLFGPDLWRRGETVYPHTSFSSAANRLSYFLNVRGPSVPVDTMCSSSLTAVHQACQAILAGECQAAIVGGVNVYLHPSSYVGLSAARMLSRDGVCRSFGRGGNGFVPGEGVAALLLKPLSRAMADRDRIHAVIRGTHVNHGGRTNGYTVPNLVAQAELVRDALLKAGVDARAVSYVEAHGTGTELGDPIEVAGLAEAFRHFTDDTGFCALGSVKTNIGHLEAAAGIAGLVKVVLQMRHGQIAPSLHAAETNPEIDFARTPFVVPQTLTDWAGARPRLAGVSSFGAGGANAHVVLEDYRDETFEKAGDGAEAGQRHAVPLSAKTEERLRAAVARLCEFLARAEAEGRMPALADVAYTLQVGRVQMDQRLAVAVASLSELRAKLAAYLAGETVDDLHTGNAKQHKALIAAFSGDAGLEQTLAAWLARGDAARLASAWAAGLTIDWLRLHEAVPASGRAPRRIALPTYPFAETRYWLPAVAAEDVAKAPQPEAVAVAEPAPPVEVVPSVPAPRARRIRLADAAPPRAAAPAAVSKPRSLTPLAAFAAAAPGDAAVSAVAEGRVVVRDHGGGVLAVAMEALGDGRIDTAAVSGALSKAFSWIASRDVKVVLLRGLDALKPDVPGIEGVRQAVRDAAAPVVAVLTGDNGAAAMSIAAACDLTIACADGSFIWNDTRCAGETLRRHAFTGPVVAAAEIDAQAIEIARSIARGSSVAVAALKAHLSRQAETPRPEPARQARSGLSRLALRPVPGAETPRRVPLGSEVVTLDRYANGVAVVTLAERAHKNTFTPRFVEGVLAAFAHVSGNPDYKAVVLTGFDSYFACGGTREGLLAIQSGRARFTDEQSYAAPLRCDIPVIAAMQGHGIGAGWAMGLYCDWAVLAEESVYQSPYMLYGFTPGAGSTLIFPARLGSGLAREVLFTARAFQGRELRERGIASPVVARSEVLRHALDMAHGLAQATRADLVREKAERAGCVRARLEATFAAELDLHARTFVGNAEVVANIGRYFNEAAKGEAEAVVVPADTPASEGAAPRVLHALRQSLADELQMRVEDVDDRAAFLDVGMDSISAVTWIRKVNAQYGLSMAATKVYSHPTLAAFHAHVMELGRAAGAAGFADAVSAAVRAEAAPAAVTAPVVVASFPFSAGDALPSSRAAEPPRPSPLREQSDEAIAIAIVGMAGRFPKARDVREFWANIMAGRDCVIDIPSERWDVDAYYDPDVKAAGKTVCRRMGVLEDVDLFDPLFFSISPSEAEQMDPQQRLFLETAWHAIEDAGYDPAGLSEALCGVFVGCQGNDYGRRMAGRPPTAHGLIGESVAMLPARIAYALNLRGPCLAIDTACSASLVAIANACDSLVLGTSDIALAGGVYVSDGPDIHLKMSNAGMLSPEGRCFSFDERANGFVLGEGVGVLMLKRLGDARRDGDAIHGVIRGWAVNQDGRTNGITAPSQPSQTALESGLYEKFAIDPADIRLVEAHGTGTKLGDPIEVEALTSSFRRFTDRAHFCALGSVKSNIGHLATAAGVAGVVKAVLALKARCLPPTINYEKLNPHIALEGSPFFVNTRAQPWPEDGAAARLAAVSSFGFSGTNAHVVLAGVAAEPVDAMGDVPVLLPLSAKSDAQLAAYARSVAAFLADQATRGGARLADIAHTFQIGRTAMSRRLAVVGRSAAELSAALLAFAETGAAAAEPSGNGEAETAPLFDMARRWMAGEAVDWSLLPQRGPLRRLNGLPTYPFARERYWMSLPEDEMQRGPAVSAAAASPSFDASHWPEVPLEEGIDWQGRLRLRLAESVLAVHGDDAARAAFTMLVSQLATSCGVTDGARISYSPVREAAAQIAAHRPQWLVTLGEDASRAAIASGWCAGRRVAALLFSDVAGADGFGADLAAGSGAPATAALVVSQSGAADLAGGVQRLVREWLAFGAEAPGAPAAEIHYDAARRLQRTSRKAAVTEESIGLITTNWRRASVEATPMRTRRGTALVLVNDLSAEIAEELFCSGEFERVVVAGEGAAHALDFSDPQAAVGAAKALIARYPDITHVFDLVALRAAPQDHDADPLGRIGVYQMLVAACADLTILCVTCRLKAFRCTALSLAGAKVAGLVKMLGADYAHVDARVIDIDAAAYEEPGALGRILAREIESPPGPTEVCYRAGDRYLPELSLAAPEAVGDTQFRIGEDGVYVVSGGTNGVGLEIAQLLADRGARKIVLLGRTPLPPRDTWRNPALLADLPPYVRAKLGALCALDDTLAHLDVHIGALTDAAALRRLFLKVRSTLGPIRGVVHSAAVYSDAAAPGFVDKSLDGMRRVMEAKVGGLEALHAVLKSDPLDFFVSFASMTGVVPRLARGAADYAMANAFVEAFTAHRNAEDGGRDRYKAIVWSDWNETGGITRVSPERARGVAETFRGIGLRTFSNQEGRALFERAMACKTGGSVVIGYVDPEAFEAARPRLLLARGEARAGVAPAADMAPAGDVAEQVARWEAEVKAGGRVPAERIGEAIRLDALAGLDPALIGRIHKVMFGQPPVQAAAVAAEPARDYRAAIATTVMGVLKLKTVSAEQPLQNYGLDSISATVLAARLEKQLDIEIRPQWLIEFPTIEALARHLATQDAGSVPA